MHALWCCGLRRQRDKNISFTSIFKSTRNPPAVNTSGPQCSKSKLRSEQVSPFEGPVELCQIVGCHAEAEDAEIPIPFARVSTFEAVKTRFIKRLSQEIDSRRHSRVSIGHSDEELARRAEVRRLRQKRIQDELERDNENGNDAISNKSHDSPRQLATLIDMGSPACQIASPRSGPRDTLEFTFDDCAVASDPTSSDLSSTQSTLPHENFHLPDVVNEHIYYEPGRSTLQEAHPGMVEKRSQPSLDQAQLPEGRIAPKTSLSPRPSSCEPGSPRLERILGLESDFNIRHGSHAWDDQSALGVWLIAQGMKSLDNSVPHFEQTAAAENRSSKYQSLTSDEIAGVDSIIESSSSTPAGANKPRSLVLARTENAQDKSPNIGGNGIDEFRNSENSSNLNEPVKCFEKPDDKGSSNYPSALPSFDPSPSSSGTNTYLLSEEDLENLELSPIHWYGRLSSWKELGNSEEKSSYTTAEEQIFSNITDGSDATEPLNSYDHQSKGKKHKPKDHCMSVSQGTSVDVNLTLPTCTAASRSGTNLRDSSSQSQERWTVLPQKTPIRTSIKEKLQQSFSGLSKLGASNNTDARMAVSLSKRSRTKPTMVTKERIERALSCDMVDCRRSSEGYQSNNLHAMEPSIGHQTN
ncbi:hypothetical protein QQS21_005738 [Conoideocrella luteorostrata]|uniref:Uncharacterized protein n=1 Tax=Conoideocrella luteorostrata TaxID=1105319 RepID=A0AAJ0CRB4_9HYPO|nr:hypothetical protein QQS21_005738 [Conoideocrella luteorostrata]